MREHNVIYPAEILLPEAKTDMEKWAVVACDQFTSQPEYWQETERLVGDAPSTLRMILPEAYLEAPGVAEKTRRIHDVMQQYRSQLLLRKINGFVYIERDTGRPEKRAGLAAAIDLEDYSFEKGAKPLIRPSENTVVERIPPRLAVRKGGCLEAPHIMMLLDDASCSVIEPLAGYKNDMELLYDTPLMQGGGSIRGWAVTEKALVEKLQAALRELCSQEAFDRRYPAAAGQPPIALAVGDGNHSLATAKAYWEEIKKELPQEQRETHPARYCLVEIVNIHSPAIEVEPIHRVLFGAQLEETLAAAKQFFAENGCGMDAGEGHRFVFCADEDESVLTVNAAKWPIATGTIEAFLTHYLAGHPDVRVDYIHGEDTVRRMAAKGAVGVVLPEIEKGDLFKGVVLGGVLPKKTFSMGHAEEKRYYMECRAITL
ncbi:MAG: DUF1015 domain-containing protein [Oscillospiraceae bacterium]|nr:DUF1015 domain-containing protein [Oscillospiraceae bacterium]